MINEESLQQLKFPDALQRESNNWFVKQGISQNIAMRPVNITSILKNFKSLIKQVYQKGWTHKFSNKRDQNNYFRPAISQR